MGGQTSTTYTVETNDTGLVITRTERTVKKNQEWVHTKKYDVPISSQMKVHLYVDRFGGKYIHVGEHEFLFDDPEYADKIYQDIMRALSSNIFKLQGDFVQCSEQGEVSMNDTRNARKEKTQ